MAYAGQLTSVIL